MHSFIKMVPMLRAQFFQEWLETAWKQTPSKVITIPINHLVLFGAVSQDGTQRVSFGLEAEDARIIGEQLIKAAKEAGQC